MKEHYDPNQPRDDHGRWGSGGGGSSIEKILRSSQIAPLTNGERQAIEAYRAVGTDINNRLRKIGVNTIENPMFPKYINDLNHTIRTLDGSFNKFALSEDIKAHRIMPESVHQLIASKPDGTLMTDKAFVSTTHDEKMVKTYLNLHWDRKMVPYEIYIPKTARAIPWLAQDIDSEVLLARGTKFRKIGQNKLEVVR